MKPSTELIDGHYDPQHARNAVKMPLYLSSNYVFSSAEEAKKLFEQKGVQPTDQDHAAPQDMIYSRLGHPNLLLAEARLAAYEGTESALFFESGMAAISTLFMGVLRPGDTVLHSTPLYGGSDHLLRGMMQAWRVHLMEFSSEERVDQIIARIQSADVTPSIRLIYIETPANPNLQFVDFKLVTELSHQIQQLTGQKPLTACDN
ncbi:MAG: PLP-dependent transferase, partial [Bacteroidetes bacterium]|nr:PLP-dependent transferase [Bacteroidota bacterium]